MRKHLAPVRSHLLEPGYFISRAIKNRLLRIAHWVQSTRPTECPILERLDFAKLSVNEADKPGCVALHHQFGVLAKKKVLL